MVKIKYLVDSPLCPGGQVADAWAPGAVLGHLKPCEASVSQASSFAPSAHIVTPFALVPATEDTWHRNSPDF